MISNKHPQLYFKVIIYALFTFVNPNLIGQSITYTPDSSAVTLLYDHFILGSKNNSIILPEIKMNNLEDTIKIDIRGFISVDSLFIANENIEIRIKAYKLINHFLFKANENYFITLEPIINLNRKLKRYLKIKIPKINHPQIKFQIDSIDIISK